MHKDAKPKPVRLLSETVANQIAAGEVVERPASVLKELIENALDAGADRLAIEVGGAGRGLIRLVDNGWGMSEEDMLMALERHATSKLSSSEDLEAVDTLGFRGEALPSIAAVSKLMLRSRRGDAETGHEVRVSGGSIRQVEEVGCPQGTVVEVRDLFFNTPARRKFLKSRATENGHLGEAVLRLALARPQVALRYSNNGKVLWDLQASDDLAVRAAAVLGRGTTSQMTRLDEDAGAFQLSGLAGLPSVSRPAADQVYTFVNGRYVRDKVLLHAVAQAYRGLMPDGRRPVVVLKLGMDPRSVDVNVHPAKIEVRFHQQREVHDSLVRVLRRGLSRSRPSGVQAPAPVRPPLGGAKPGRPSAHPPRREIGPEPKDFMLKPGADQGPADLAGSPAPSLPIKPVMDRPQTGGVPSPNKEPGRSLDADSGHEPIPSALGPQARALFGPAGDLTVLGQLHGLYIVCASPQGLVIMDQHAAHERLTYEALKKELNRGELPSQGLLTPATLELSPREAAWAQDQADDWARLGLAISPFGGNTWVISAAPPDLAGQDPALVVKDLLSELASAGVPSGTPEFLEVGLRSVACRSSIKQGQRLGTAELTDLAARASALPPPVTCPHGRPVFLSLTRRELAKHFKRSSEGGPK